MIQAGVLWLKKTKDGKTFFSGIVEIEGIKTKVVIFKNDYKQGDTHPDYKIYLQEESRYRQEVEPDEDNPPFNPFE
jgi:uncharacterized protein (DUF736 family)